MTLLPAGAAYQFHAARPGVVMLQTLAGRDTVERWADGVAGEHGFTDVSHTLEIFGTCPDC